MWFPHGRDDNELALLEVKVERVRYWTRPASMLTYALAYLRARLSRRPAEVEKIAETRTIIL